MYVVHVGMAYNNTNISWLHGKVQNHWNNLHIWCVVVRYEMMLAWGVAM